ncbi:MAG TPA: metal-dependent transcriptional regulator [Halobacteriales archaeon]|nr:metal-dependent transcriptional regulator [Halobacteriales archaeon]
MDPTDEPGVTEASARYLVAVFRLWAESGRRASTGDIADRLDVEPSSVTDMLGKLDAAGYLDHSPHRGVELTPAGAEFARALSRRQCVVEAFFDSLGTSLGAERAHAIGYRLPAAAVDWFGGESGLECGDRCRAGEEWLEDCPKLAGVGPA